MPHFECDPNGSISSSKQNADTSQNASFVPLLFRSSKNHESDFSHTCPPSCDSTSLRTNQSCLDAHSTELERIRLTQLTSKGGWAAKWGPGDLRDILSSFNKTGSAPVDSRLLLGYETNDDAAVWKINDSTAAVLTVDFFTPIVDDPYEFGCIAAANALSDVFAMGAQPHVALNLLALDANLGSSVASAILEGGATKVREAGAFVSGGHTIDDPEPKYGLCVFGSVDPHRIMQNKGAQVGDVLYLTKPLGTGILSAAFKINHISQNDLQCAIESMKELNAAGSHAMIAAEAHAATDITGFGLAGHLCEMLKASNCSAELDFNALPLFDHVWDLSCAYCRPGKTFAIMDDLEGFIDQGSLDDEIFDNRLGVLCDPQTSGGLLVALSPDHADVFEKDFKAQTGRTPTRIGSIIEGNAGTIRFSDS